MDDAVPKSRRGKAGPVSGAEPGLPEGGSAFGKYELRGVLGEGGTGIVYDAIRTSDG